jgi:hypothetical protein
MHLIASWRLQAGPPTTTMEHRSGSENTQIINPQVLLAARFVRFRFMINLLRAFTPRIAHPV